MDNLFCLQIFNIHFNVEVSKFCLSTIRRWFYLVPCPLPFILCINDLPYVVSDEKRNFYTCEAIAIPKRNAEKKTSFLGRWLNCYLFLNTKKKTIAFTWSEIASLSTEILRSGNQ